jgi:hypothetical protein
MAINLSSLIDSATNIVGDVLDSTSSVQSLTPGFDINTPTSGYFDGVDDALGRLGGELRSPAFSGVDAMKNASTSLNITENLDLVAAEVALGDDWPAAKSTLDEIQGFSDTLDECGNYAQDALSAATTDYIKNTGIQEAGRELADKIDALGGDGGTDCLAGFATLFDSAGIIDDALGLGDLPQIQSRVSDIIRDITDPSALSNMLMNLDVVSGLLDSFNDMCTGMKDAFNKLIAADLASMMGLLTKLAQWAAFAKLANSDPCSLVNNNQMLSHIAEPVMDDIVKLYNSVTGGTAGPDNPIINLGDILGTNTLPSVPKFKQQAGVGLQSFDSYKTNITGELAAVKGTIIATTYHSVPMDFVDGEWIENSAMKDKSSFTQSIVKGNSPIDNSTGEFTSARSGVNNEVLNTLPKRVHTSPIVQNGVPGNATTTLKSTDSVVKPEVNRGAAAELTLLKPDKGSGKDLVSHLPNVVIKPKEGAKGATIESVAEALLFEQFDCLTCPGGKKEEFVRDGKVVTGYWDVDLNGNVVKQPFPTPWVQPIGTICGCIGGMSESEVKKGLYQANRKYDTIRPINQKNYDNYVTAAKALEDRSWWEGEDEDAVEAAGKLKGTWLWSRTRLRAYDAEKELYSNDPYSSAESCGTLGGTWKCSPHKANESLNSVGNRNMELKTTLPTSKAFDTSKIG